VVDINDGKAVDGDRLVEAVDLPAAADAVAGVIDKAVTVVVVDVLGDDRQVADVDLQVRVRGARAVGVEDDELVRAALVGNGGDVDAGGGELLVEDGAVGKASEVED
jgi:hypothetical protein